MDFVLERKVLYRNVFRRFLSRFIFVLGADALQWGVDTDVFHAMEFHTCNLQMIIFFCYQLLEELGEFLNHRGSVLSGLGA